MQKRFKTNRLNEITRWKSQLEKKPFSNKISNERFQEMKACGEIIKTNTMDAVSETCSGGVGSGKVSKLVPIWIATSSLLILKLLSFCLLMIKTHGVYVLLEYSLVFHNSKTSLDNSREWERKHVFNFCYQENMITWPKNNALYFEVFL